MQARGAVNLSTGPTPAAVSAATVQSFPDLVGLPCPIGRQEDCWCLRDGVLVWAHAKPRRRRFTPDHAPARVVPWSRRMNLRVTAVQGQGKAIRDSWRGPEAHRELESNWTGTTPFCVIPEALNAGALATHTIQLQRTNAIRDLRRASKTCSRTEPSGWMWGACRVGGVPRSIFPTGPVQKCIMALNEVLGKRVGGRLRWSTVLVL